MAGYVIIIAIMNYRGFTIVELLIVIVVIAILAAIAIVSYNGIQSRANDTAVQNDLNNFAKKMELYKVDNGTYPHDSTNFNYSLGISFSRSAYGYDVQSSNLNYCHNSVTDQYVIVANSKSGKYFQYMSNDGLRLASSSDYGWNVCGKVGIGSTNPSPRGVTGGTTWASWVN